MATFAQKVQGALYGVAIGDAMGAPVEGWSPEAIAERFDPADLERFLPPTHGGEPAAGKGDGRVTDDTLLTEALICSYLERGDHLDAHGYARYMVPRIGKTPVWVPEFQRRMPLFERLWLPEKYAYIRLTVGSADPRTAGVGNCVNCGAAMWIMPVGAVNAGDPPGAYQEAAAVAAAHNESFAVEAAAVLAAAYAAGFAAGAAIPDTLDAAAVLARDGTARAVRAAIDAADPAEALPDWIERTRGAVEPYDPATATTDGLTNKGRPSGLHSIEELPVALAALKYGDGDFRRTLEAGVFYGRDCDSIAGMAGGLFGAIHGVDAIPEALRAASDAANRRDFGALAADLSRTARAILEQDGQRIAHRSAAVTA